MLNLHICLDLGILGLNWTWLGVINKDLIWLQFLLLFEYLDFGLMQNSTWLMDFPHFQSGYHFTPSSNLSNKLLLGLSSSQSILR